METEFPQEFYDYQSPQLFSIKELLDKCVYEKDYSPIFPKFLKISENLAKTYEDQYFLFHKSQKSIPTFLIVKAKDQTFAVFLDLSETEYWRGELNKYRDLPCWLFNIDGFSLLDERKMPPQLLEIVTTTSFWTFY